MSKETEVSSAKKEDLDLPSHLTFFAVTKTLTSACRGNFRRISVFLFVVRLVLLRMQCNLSPPIGGRESWLGHFLGRPNGKLQKKL